MGKVLVRWLRRLEGPDTGLALAQKVGTLAPSKSNQVQGFQSQVKHFRPRGAQQPHLTASLCPQAQGHGHACSRILTPTPTPYTQRAVKALDPPLDLDPGMSLDWQPAGQVHGRRRCQGSGPSEWLLIGCLAGIYPIAVHVHWF